MIKEETMDGFHITYEDLSEYRCLKLRFEGLYHAGHSQAVLIEGLRLLKELGYERCLVDIKSAEYDMTVSEMYSRAELWEKTGVPRYLKIAHVTAAESVPHYLEFLENVLTNRGWNIRRFTSTSEALEWLAGTLEK